MKSIFSLIFLVSSSYAIAQNTVGLISYSQANTYQGYTMIYPHNQANVYLIDNCGEIVHMWEGEEGFKPGNTAYLLDNGDMISTKRPSDVSQDAIWAGGGGAIIEIKNWDNEVLWSYELNNESFRLHHDITMTDDGNIIAIAWEKKTLEEAMAAGRDTSNLSEGELWPEYLFEISPITNEILWEWHAWDHLIQDHDPTANNFGVIADNPRKIDINYDTNDGKADWLHMNSIDYHPGLDQVMVSVPQFDEIWVIDHTTTTAQAATSSGGLTNHGGDIIYRVGNPLAYDNGTVEDQILHYQHDAHWMLDLPVSHPQYGHIALFNNRVGEDYSTAETFPSAWMDYISDYQQFNNTWPPYDLDNTITHPVREQMYSTGLSSVQLLSNGNSLLCSGRQGYVFELNEDDDIVWEFVTPIKAGQAVDQGTILELNNNLTFRAHKYSLDHPAFENKVFSGGEWIETNPDMDYCEELISSTEVDDINTLISPNPASGMVKVSWDTGMMIDVLVTDLAGRTLISEMGNGGLMYLDIQNLNPGLYLITLDNKSTRKLVVR